MTRHLLVAFTLLGLAGGTAHAQRIEPAPIARTSPIDGKAMFESYCQACHGAAGLGDGPAAKALTKAPADLTKISARNGGQFPNTRVKRYIEGLDEVPAHGSRDMPMWGSLFRALNRDMAQQRVETLARYLEAMQK